MGCEVPSAVSDGVSLIGCFVPNILVLRESIAANEEQHLSASSAGSLQANCFSPFKMESFRGMFSEFLRE